VNYNADAVLAEQTVAEIERLGVKAFAQPEGTFLCTQFAARHMKEQGGGAIVNIGSGCNY
jgi:NAD(P)-dependent dehydrogenase (short-subunit alcohol dehydrogenase family)